MEVRDTGKDHADFSVTLMVQLLAEGAHIIPELIVQEVGSHVGWKEIVEDTFVGLLQHCHLFLLLGRLQLPDKVQARCPLHLSSMCENGDHEDDDACKGDRVEGNDTVEALVVALEDVNVRELDEEGVDDGHDHD